MDSERTFPAKFATTGSRLYNHGKRLLQESQTGHPIILDPHNFRENPYPTIRDAISYALVNPFRKLDQAGRGLIGSGTGTAILSLVKPKYLREVGIDPQPFDSEGAFPRGALKAAAGTLICAANLPGHLIHFADRCNDQDQRQQRP